VRASDRLLLVAAPAAALASVDLIVKANVPTTSWAFHHRSNVWVALSVALLIGALMLTLVPSSTVALAAGVMSGGVIGNLVSARSDGNWVPNPLAISGYGYGVAFNLADVFFLLGNLLLMATLIAATRRHQERLITLRAWERALLRRFGF
jgi:lipoprotein signal peptidase